MRKAFREIIEYYEEKGWKLGKDNWMHKDPGLGIHLVDSGSGEIFIDMQYNCPYVPLTMKETNYDDRIQFKKRTS